MHVAGNVPRSVQIVSAALPHIGKVIGSWIRAAADPRWCALCGFSNPAGCSGTLSPTDGGFHDPCTTSTFRLVSDPLLFPRKQILLQYGFAFRFSFCLSDQLQESWCSISILTNCLFCVYHDPVYIPDLVCPFPSASPVASLRLSITNWDDLFFFLALDVVICCICSFSSFVCG